VSRSIKDAQGDENTDQTRVGGRHPKAKSVEMRLTIPAFDDLKGLKKSSPEALRWALKKLIQIRRDPDAGRPLHAELQGWRKITVGDRDWRVIWRVYFDESGFAVVDIAEVWAIGARSDGEVYNEMKERVASLPQNPQTVALEEVLKFFEKKRDEQESVEEPLQQEALPDWLVSDLVELAGAGVDEVQRMSMEEALKAWGEFRSRPK
jgi:mRNA interferase RelE/StbE